MDRWYFWLMVVLFFFKQKTADEMRISDWRSDVCSSDLTEAASDLALLAGMEPAGVLVEILNPDGSMARRPELEVFAREHGLKIGSSEERRVGQECVRKWRSRWSPNH